MTEDYVHDLEEVPSFAFWSIVIHEEREQTNCKLDRMHTFKKNLVCVYDCGGTEVTCKASLSYLR